MSNDSHEIREVWAWNLDDEFKVIREIVDNHMYIAMDTEFPGTVVEPIPGIVKNENTIYYNRILANVNITYLIQLGLTFSDENGNLPACGSREKPCCWQFNFQEFNIDRDIHFKDSTDLLSRSGIDFKKNHKNGIDVRRFGELLMSSGAVLNHDTHWISFQGGFDFGYLIKLLSGMNLPDAEAEFMNLVRIYFPTVYDVKYLMVFCDGLHGGLNKLANQLDIERVGTSHQAGSDSLLTCKAFMKMKRVHFGKDKPIERYVGVLHGFGNAR